MSTVLLATDSDHLAAEVDATLANDDCQVLRVRNGSDVLPVIEAMDPQLVILDMQIGSMGGVATCIAIRQEEGAQRLARRSVALLLDRDVDRHIAAEAQSEGWLMKPIDSLRLRKLYRELLGKGTYYDGRLEAAS